MNLGFPEMLFLGLLALLLFGPRRLPEIGRQIGKALGEFKRASSDFQNQLEDEVRQLEVEQESKQTIAPPAPEGSIAQTAPATPGVSSTLPASSNRSDTANGDPGTNRGDGAKGA